MWPNRMLPKEDVSAAKRFRRTTSMRLINSNSHTVEPLNSADAVATNKGSGGNEIKVRRDSAGEDTQRLRPANGKHDPGNFKVAKAQEVSAFQSKLLCRPEGERPPGLMTPVDFLDFCFCCKRRLRHERDIFIYRGDTAFCSEECRDKQIANDEKTDKGGRKGSARGTAAAA